MKSRVPKIRDLSIDGAEYEDFELLDSYGIDYIRPGSKVGVVLTDDSFVAVSDVATVVRTLRESNYGIAADQLEIVSVLRNENVFLSRNGNTQPLLNVTPGRLWGHVEAHSEKLDQGIPDALGLSVVVESQVLGYCFSNAATPLLHIARLLGLDAGSRVSRKMLMAVTGQYLVKRKNDTYCSSFLEEMTSHMRNLTL